MGELSMPKCDVRVPQFVSLFCLVKLRVCPASSPARRVGLLRWARDALLRAAKPGTRTARDASASCEAPLVSFAAVVA